VNKRPNVLMVAIDCLRSDRIFGPERTCKTPNIDRLMKRSVRVPNMFVENSITAPAFTTIFTGCYSLGHGVTGLLGVRLNENMVTMADALVGAGYRTYAEVTGPLLPMLGIDQGFDEYNYRPQQQYSFSEWGDALIQRIKTGGLQEPWFNMVHFWELHEPRQVLPEFDTPEFGASDYDRALSSLDPYLGRLFEAVGEDTVIILTGDHGERIDEEAAADSMLHYFMKKLGVERLGHEQDAQGDTIDLLATTGEDLHEVSQSLRTISTDGAGRIPLLGRLGMIGRLLRVGAARLKTQKREPGFGGFVKFLKMKWEDFRIGWSVAMGDSRDAQLRILRTTLGQFYLQHGYHIYDYLAQVPFAIAGLASLPADKTVDSHVRNIDILPTLCDLLKLDPPPIDWHGATFAPLLTNGAYEERPIYMETRGGAQAVHAFYIRGVRSGGQKLAYAPYDTEAPVELYDLAADAAEEINVVAEHADAAARLRQEAEAMAAAFSASQAGQGMSAEEQQKMIAKLKSLGYM
jgi:arylsulfatase A-like enzyme